MLALSTWAVHGRLRRCRRGLRRRGRQWRRPSKPRQLAAQRMGSKRCRRELQQQLQGTDTRQVSKNGYLWSFCLTRCPSGRTAYRSELRGHYAMECLELDKLPTNCQWAPCEAAKATRIWRNYNTCCLLNGPMQARQEFCQVISRPACYPFFYLLLDPSTD